MQERHQLILDYCDDRKNLNEPKEIQQTLKFLKRKRPWREEGSKKAA